MLAEETKAGTIAELTLESGGPGFKLAPVGFVSVLPEGEAARRIVHREDGRLMISARFPLAPRMERIAFDLGRAAVVDLDHKTLSSSAERHGRVVEVRSSWNVVFDAARMRHDVGNG